MFPLLWKVAFALIAVQCANAFDDVPRLDPAISTVRPHDAPSSDSCVGQVGFVCCDKIAIIFF
jgi:hypothetical protein